MATRIAAWNVAKNLGDEKRASRIEEGIKRLDADVVVLSEALAAERGVTPKIDVSFARSLGYEAIFMTVYADDEPREEDLNLELYLMVMARAGVELEMARLATRNAISIHINDEHDGNLHGVGAHFDDRLEPTRQAMAQAFLAENPDFLIGDLSAMHQQSCSARLMRSGIARAAAHHAPVARVQSLGTRLHGMADGGTMRLLTDAGYVDADPRKRPTFTHTGIRFGQLDHLLYSPHVDVQDFDRHAFSGSDHLAISALIRRTLT